MIGDEKDEWPEQADIPVDDEMLGQFPQEELLPATFLGEWGPGELYGDEEIEYVYPIGHDAVISLDRAEYNEAQATERMIELCKIRGVVPVERMFYTSRYWCLRVVNRRINEEVGQ
jgi:hypothetical protein